MCAILGGTLTDVKLLRTMARSMKHRGPDATRMKVRDSFSLVHNRLSIIDPSQRSHQPLLNEDETLILVCNGEIYNYKSLRGMLSEKGHEFMTHSDSEVILHLYEEYGASAFSKLNGIFAFALYDMNAQTVFLVRDPVGVKPLYYYADKKHFIFASELKPFQHCPFVPISFNTKKLPDFLQFRYVPGEETFFEGINKLLPSHYITYDIKSNTMDKKRYVSLYDQTMSKKRLHNHMGQELESAVNRQMMSDVPLGVFLSGGLDSSAIVSLMKNTKSEETVNTYSVGFSHDEMNLDMKRAKQVSSYCNTDHHTIQLGPDSLYSLPSILSMQDDPVIDPTIIPTYYLSQRAQKDVKVVLTGEGADELFGGYVQNKPVSLTHSYLSRIPCKKVWSRIPQKIPDSIVSTLFKYPSTLGKEGKRRLSDFLYYSNDKKETYLNFISLWTHKEQNEILKCKNPQSRFQHSLLGYFDKKRPLTKSIYRFEMENWLPEYILNRLDRMTMAHGLEGRVPFLDTSFIPYVNSLSQKRRNNKEALRNVMKKKLPSNIVRRRKYPFTVPLERWFGKEYHNFSRSILEENRFIQKTFKKQYINKLLDTKQTNLLHSRRLWGFITLASWHDTFIQKRR